MRSHERDFVVAAVVVGRRLVMRCAEGGTGQEDDR